MRQREQMRVRSGSCILHWIGKKDGQMLGAFRIVHIALDMQKECCSRQLHCL